MCSQCSQDLKCAVVEQGRQAVVSLGGRGQAHASEVLRSSQALQAEAQVALPIRMATIGTCAASASARTAGPAGIACNNEIPWASCTVNLSEASCIEDILACTAKPWSWPLM